MASNNLYLYQKIIIYQNTKLCPHEIINHTGEEAIIKGFKNIGKGTMMPLVEFKNNTRMWILYEESNHVSSKIYMYKKH